MTTADGPLDRAARDHDDGTGGTAGARPEPDEDPPGDATWGRSLTDEEFTRAVRQVLRTGGPGAAWRGRG